MTFKISGTCTLICSKVIIFFKFNKNTCKTKGKNYQGQI